MSTLVNMQVKRHSVMINNNETEIKQLAFEINAFLFQNILQATLLHNGLLVRGNQAFGYIQKYNTIVPVVVQPALASSDQPKEFLPISLFNLTSITYSRLVQSPSMADYVINYLANRLQEQYKHFIIKVLSRSGTSWEILSALKIMDVQLTREQAIMYFGSQPKCTDEIVNELRKIFCTENSLPGITPKLTNSSPMTTITLSFTSTSDGYSAFPYPYSNLTSLIELVICIARYAASLGLPDFTPPSDRIINLTSKDLERIEQAGYICNFPPKMWLPEPSFDFYRFCFEAFETPIKLPISSTEKNRNVQPNQFQPNQFQPNQFQPKQFQPNPLQPYQFPTPLVIEPPPISSFCYNYNYIYGNLDNMDIGQSELLLLFRVEAELLKKLKDPEAIHPFNLDRPLFSIWCNGYLSMELKPADLYAFNFQDHIKMLDKLPENQKAMSALDQEAYQHQLDLYQSFRDLGCLHLLHYVAYQRTGKTSLDAYDLIRTAYEVAERLDIPTDEESLYCSSPLNGRGDFSEAMEIAPKQPAEGKYIEFRGHNGQTYYHALKVALKRQSIYIPEVFASVHQFAIPVPLLLPPKHHHLFNEELVASGSETLVINPDLPEAASNGKEMSWWGGDKTLKQLDFKIFNGRAVHCLCHGLFDFELSLKVCARLREAGATPGIHFICTSRPDNAGHDYRESEFARLAEQLDYDGDMHGFMEEDEPQAQQKGVKTEVLEGYFTTRELILLLGQAKVGKTYVGLSLGLSIVTGRPMHDYWKPSPGFKGDVYYCYGEMDDEDISKRIKALVKSMGLDGILKRDGASWYIANEEDSNAEGGGKPAGRKLLAVDLRGRVGGQFDVTVEEHREKLLELLQMSDWKDRGAFIVFDNYISIVGDNSSVGDAKFNKSYAFFTKLMNQGACVMLTHHTNSDKEIAATKQIERKVNGVIRLTSDNVLENEIREQACKISGGKKPEMFSDEIKSRLMKANCPEGLDIYVTYQYFRDKGVSDLTPLHMTLDTKQDSPWNCEALDIKEIIERVAAEFGKRRECQPQTGKAAYDALKELEPDKARKDILQKVMSHCGGKRDEALNLPLKDLAALYGASGEKFAAHVGKNILSLRKSATIKDIREMIEEEYRKQETESSND